MTTPYHRYLISKDDGQTCIASFAFNDRQVADEYLSELQSRDNAFYGPYKVFDKMKTAETDNFKLEQVGHDWFLVCKHPNHDLQRVKIEENDVIYLSGLSASEFDGAANMDYGCGVHITDPIEDESA